MDGGTSAVATAQPGEPLQTGGESNDTRGKGRVQINKKGLITAVIVGLLGVTIMSREAQEMGRWIGLISVLGAIALAVRSFWPGMTLGRGILTWLGGYLIGWGLFMVALVRFDEIGVSPWTLIFIVGMAGLCLWTGFKKGKIQWRRKK